MSLSGTQLAGGKGNNNRVENDFYATNPIAVKMLLDKLPMPKLDIRKGLLEPSVGQGHIIEGISSWIHDHALNNVDIKKYTTCLDIEDRGYPNTIVQDFLTYNPNKKFEWIITNPPFSCATDFVKKGMELLDDNGRMDLFLKIQFLEGELRTDLFNKYPPKYIYVFRNRMATWNNGKPTDSTGKKWATTMCHAWFVWYKNSKTEPIVRWLDKK